MNSSTPNLAEVTRTLLLANSIGTMATQSIKHPGFPYSSIMPYAITNSGNPIFFISALATHTRNLKADPKASVLVADQSGDPLASGRATLIGTVEKVVDQEIEAAKSTYFDAHPKSRQWGGFHDFAIYQMQVVDVYVVAGFGSMGWVKPNDFSNQFKGSDQ